VATAVPHGFIDDPKEFTDIERLGEITASACGHETLDLSGGSVRADNDNRNVARELILPQTCQDLVSGKVWQMKIE
jgi:hypothetical protein